RTTLGLTPSPRMLVVRRRSDGQNSAHRLDSVDALVVVDERHHHFGRRSSSACAKYAEAFRRISSARRSSLSSRSRSLIRALSSVVGPGRPPLSRCACRTQTPSVSGLQPILAATDPMAAHSDAWFGRVSATSRTARSRTSGEYLLSLAMFPILP